MSMLTKWNSLGKSNELEQWGPITRWDPRREMDEIMRGMQHIFPGANDESMTLAEWSPTVDIGESDQEYVIKAELPDVKKDDIKVNILDGMLSITGERRVEKEENKMKYHRLERAYGRFQRTFTLPEETDTDNISSEYKEGILTVHMPKNPSLKPTSHRVSVQ